MKAILYLLPTLLGAFTLASAVPEKHCECPMAKCPAEPPSALCECINARERKCKDICPRYKPTYTPCPVSPPTPSPTETCVCEQMMCAQLWPNSCYCGNANLKRCWEQCGKKGPEPAYQSCPPLTSEGTPTPTSTLKTSTTTKRPRPTNAVCGGGRANYMQCEEGLTCIKDPRNSGCGPECDGLGICVVDKMCGGFAGFKCDNERMLCLDDPRDDCDPKTGGADCAGLCMW